MEGGVGLTEGVFDGVREGVLEMGLMEGVAGPVGCCEPECEDVCV